MDRRSGMFRVIAETTVNIPQNAEWLYPYSPHTRSVGDPNWLLDTSAFDWNGSRPSFQADFLVRCIIARQYNLKDIALLAVDFTRRDYRDMTVSLPSSVWIPFFIGDYTRNVGGGTRRHDDY